MNCRVLVQSYQMQPIASKNDHFSLSSQQAALLSNFPDSLENGVFFGASVCCI